MVQQHKCTLNHDGSATKTEQSGVVRIFGRSLVKYNLRYSDYNGDEDTKSFSAVKNTYDGITVVKKSALATCKSALEKGLRQLKKMKRSWKVRIK